MELLPEALRPAKLFQRFLSFGCDAGRFVFPFSKHQLAHAHCTADASVHMHAMPHPQEEQKPPETKSTQIEKSASQQVFLNYFRWVFLTRVTGKKGKVRADFSKKFVQTRCFSLAFRDLGWVFGPLSGACSWLRRVTMSMMSTRPHGRTTS